MGVGQYSLLHAHSAYRVVLEGEDTLVHYPSELVHMAGRRERQGSTPTQSFSKKEGDVPLNKGLPTRGNGDVYIGLYGADCKCFNFSESRERQTHLTHKTLIHCCGSSSSGYNKEFRRSIDEAQKCILTSKSLL